MNSVKKKLALLLIIAMIFAITACSGAGEGSDTTTGGEQSTPDASVQQPLLDERQLENPVIKIITSYEIWSGFKDSFSEHYGGEIEEIMVPIDGYMSKLSSMIMSGDSPDGIVNHSDFVVHFASYVSKGLVQPFDDYIDLDEPIYEIIRPAIEGAKWNDKYYFIGHQNNITEMTLYNVKLFEQVGIDTPWELYQNDEWTWDAFKEAAEMLAQDSNNDDEIDIYGGAIIAPEILVGTSGKPFGNMAGGNDIQLYIRDNDISRALQFMYDFNYKNSSAMNPPTAWAQAFTRERLAMALVPSWVFQTPEVQEISKAGNLGIAPLPRDPQHDKYSTKATIVGWLLPEDAKNPEGLVAFNKCMIYENNFNEEKESERYEDTKASWFLTDENMEQRLAVIKNPNFVPEWGKGFVHHYIWGFWEQENPWSTYVEAIQPVLEAEIREAIKGTE